MKKFTLIALLLSTASVLVAQPTLTSSNFVNTVGDSQLFYIADMNSVVDPTIGPNVTFNYTGINSDGTTRTQYVIDPTTTAFTADFLTATHADTTAGSSINKNYSKVELTDSITNIGIVANVPTYGTVIIKYDQNPETLMKFPFNYPNNYIDNYAGIFTMQSTGLATNGAGTSSVSADAWGTLMLPFGQSIDSVIRVKTIENLITDTIFITIPFPLTILPIIISAEYINYYKPSISKFPLLSFISGSYTQNNNQLDSSRTILSQYPMNITGLNNLSSINSQVNLYPNPSNSDFTNLSFNLEKNSSLSIDLINHLGQKVSEEFRGELQTGSNELKIQTSNLSKGFYFVHIKINDTILSKKLIIE